LLTYSANVPRRLCSIFVTALCASIFGCIFGCSANVPSTSSVVGGNLRGVVHGGQQPITGASIQLYAAATTGYGASATPLLTSSVVTDATGSFTITGDYACPSATSQLYIVARGGNPGLAPGTNNAASVLMTALGPCSLHGSEYTLDPSSFITINEVTTVASVYALAPFMGGDATHLGTSSTNAVGLANAFLTVNNLVNTTTGTALSVTPAGNGTPPQAAINTLANIVASCVNSDGTGSPCAALAVAATPSGGTAPTDTIQGTYNVARNPGNNVSALYGLAGATPPFQPMLSAAPNDWTLPVTYTGIGVGATVMAIDASGNIWVPGTNTGSAPYSVFELSNNGTVLSGANGYTGGGLNIPAGIAIDPAGDAWVPSTGNVVELSSSGAILSGANGFTGGGLSTPRAIAVNGQGDAWVADIGSRSLIKLDNNGNILSGPSGFLPGNGSLPFGLGIDQTGDVWVGDGVSAVTVFNNSGTVISGSGYPVTDFGPMTVSFDASGNAWMNTNDCCVINDPGALGLNNVAKLSSSGVQLSPASGYTNCISPGLVGDLITDCIWWSGDAFALDGAGNVWGIEAWQTKVNGPVPNPMFSVAVSELSNTGTLLSGANGYGYTGLLSFSDALLTPAVAVDGGGNVWLLWGGTLKELVGAATPVVTPFSLGVKNGTLGARP
jgi:hypothetical protein